MRGRAEEMEGKGWTNRGRWTYVNIYEEFRGRVKYFSCGGTGKLCSSYSFFSLQFVAIYSHTSLAVFHISYFLQDASVQCATLVMGVIVPNCTRPFCTYLFCFVCVSSSTTITTHRRQRRSDAITQLLLCSQSFHTQFFGQF